MRIRKAILTGGGRATRLYPITSTINKHLLPLANKPMIFHAIEKAVDAGVAEIFINVNPGETELQKHIGDGGHWGIKIKFFEQTGGPQGIAHVVKCAQEFINDEPFLFYLSDNILLGGLKDIFDEFEKNKYDCMLAFAKVPDNRHLGVPIFDENGKLTAVWEKPQNPPNNYGQTGVYLYGPKVFYKAFDQITKSLRGEYEISDIHTSLLKNGHHVGWKEVTGFWKDTGMPEDLLIANKLLLQQLPLDNFTINGSVEFGALVLEKVAIGAGSRIGKDVKINGPVMIGENCVLENCQIGPNVTIAQGAQISNARIADSIILDNAFINADIKIFDSLIGRGIKMIKRNGGETEGHKMIIGDKTVIEI